MKRGIGSSNLGPLWPSRKISDNAQVDLMNNFRGNQYPQAWLPRGPRPYHEGKDVGGAGSLVSFWTWPALAAACARDRLCAHTQVVLPGHRFSLGRLGSEPNLSYRLKQETLSALRFSFHVKTRVGVGPLHQAFGSRCGIRPSLLR